MQNVTCQDYETITADITKFSVKVKSVNAFFDAKSYVQDGDLIYEQTFT